MHVHVLACLKLYLCILTLSSLSSFLSFTHAGRAQEGGVRVPAGSLHLNGQQVMNDLPPA